MGNWFGKPERTSKVLKALLGLPAYFQLLAGNVIQAVQVAVIGKPVVAKKERETCQEDQWLSQEVVGNKRLRSVHGTYLRAHESVWKVDMIHGPPQGWESWSIEKVGDKVTLKAIHSPQRFLRAHPGGHVDLAADPLEWEQWKVQKNDNGSFSFQSAHDGWLSARAEGHLTTESQCLAWEHFWLESW